MEERGQLPATTKDHRGCYDMWQLVEAFHCSSPGSGGKTGLCAGLTGPPHILGSRERGQEQTWEGGCRVHNIDLGQVGTGGYSPHIRGVHKAQAPALPPLRSD